MISYAATMSTPLATNKLVYFQRLVIRFDGRFVNNPDQTLPRTWVAVGFDDMDNFNKFNRHLDIITSVWF